MCRRIHITWAGYELARWESMLYEVTVWLLGMNYVLPTALPQKGRQDSWKITQSSYAL